MTAIVKDVVGSRKTSKRSQKKLSEQQNNLKRRWKLNKAKSQKKKKDQERQKQDNIEDTLKTWRRV